MKIAVTLAAVAVAIAVLTLFVSRGNDRPETEYLLLPPSPTTDDFVALQDRLRRTMQPAVDRGTITIGDVHEFMSFITGGSDQQVVGWIEEIDSDSIAVRAYPVGRRSSFAIGSTTAILRGPKPVAADELKLGELVFVVAPDRVTARIIKGHGVQPPVR